MDQKLGVNVRALSQLRDLEDDFCCGEQMQKGKGLLGQGSCHGLGAFECKE